MLTERQERLVRSWREAAHQLTPPFDRERGCHRLLEAERVLTQRTRMKRWAGAAAALAVAATMILFVRAHFGMATTFTVAGQRGELGEWLATRGAEPLMLEFSEGTQVALGTGSRGRVEELDSHGARIFVERGSLRAKVVHRPGSSWRFAAGPFEIEVTGTELAVDWSPESRELAVTVTRGSVILRGPYVDALQEVRAGERCRVSLASRSVLLEQLSSDVPRALASSAATVEQSASDRGASDAQSAAAPAPRSTSARNEAAVGNEVPSWLALARDGKAAQAIAQAERVDLVKIYRSATSDELFELARAARLAGRSDIERDALLSCRRRFAGESAAARATHLLGRAAAPRQAANWFETYIREQPNGVLAREAAGRVIESYENAGDEAAARRAAQRYIASYPDGPHADLARRVLASGPGGGG